MIKVFLVLFVISLSLFSSTTVDKKINKTSGQIKHFSKTYSSVNKKMAKNAKAILKQKREILQQQKYLQELRHSLGLKEKSYKKDSSLLVVLKIEQKKLKAAQDEIEQELVFEIAKSVSLSVVLDESIAQDEEALIEVEVLEMMLRKTKEKAKKLNEKFYKNSLVIDEINLHASSLEVAISTIDKKRKKLISIHKKNKKSLRKLQDAKLAYRKSLKKLLKKQDTLKQTLAKLKIIKVDAIKKAREDAARKKAFASKVDDDNLPKVKKQGSSYQAVKTKRYRGQKTITPIYPYTLTKKYGTYTDPIYGIKIFNESISMKPKSRNAKVKTVFNGKVIYADKTAVLKNIVIVQHKNGLHTIYANLSQISPNIRKGKKIKKGYTIGRVNDELIFEVTQKSYHINPIRLFK